MSPAAISSDVARRDLVAHVHQRALRQRGVLVGALELAQVVDVHRLLAGRDILGDADDDARGVDLIHDAGPLRRDGVAAVLGDALLDARAHERRLALHQRHGLALHVRAHERAVGVVVFQEGNERRRDRDDLLGRDVDVLDVLRAREQVFPTVAAGNQLRGEAVLRVHLRVRLGDGVLPLVHGREVDDLVRHLPLAHPAIRALDEAVLVHPREGRQRVDEADVRPLRRFNGADAAVVRGVDVAHLEARALARQSAGAERRDAALVGDLRQRVRLVHELRELRGAEELARRRRGRLGVDEIVRHDRIDLHRAHALADRALHAHEAEAVLILHQLADGAHATVAQVVDVVHLAAAVLELQQRLEDRQDVFLAQRAQAVVRLEAEARVHLHAPDRRRAFIFTRPTEDRS